jgi:hypothetical protein
MGAAFASFMVRMCYSKHHQKAEGKLVHVEEITV